jgi:hypothetical protein
MLYVYHYLKTIQLRGSEKIRYLRSIFVRRGSFSIFFSQIQRSYLVFSVKITQAAEDLD